MNWIIYAIIPPALFGITTFIDKYLISKYFKDGSLGVLLVFSTLVPSLLLPFIFLYQPTVIMVTWQIAIITALNGCIYVGYLIPYFRALENEEASTIGSLFQLMPIFGYILGYIFLGESLSSVQLIAGSLTMVGSIIITTEIEEGNIKIDLKVLMYMSIVCLLIAINGIIFKHFAMQLSYWTVSFWQYIGYLLFGSFILVAFPRTRLRFVRIFKTNSIKIVSVNLLNEVIYLFGNIIINYAILLAPIAAVMVVENITPMFVLLYGVILSVFFPHIITENMEKKHILKKVVAILLIISGTMLLDRFTP